MADLTKEQYEQLPDFVKDDYQEVCGVYKHAGVVKLKGTLDDLDSKLKERDSKLNEFDQKLSAFEQSKQEEIEAARKQALEEARTKGDVEAIEQRYQEQMQDLEKRVAERTRSEVEKEFTVKSAKERAELELKEIVNSMNPADEYAAELMMAGLRNKQEVTEDGKILYLGDDGSATTLDKNGFAKEQIESKKFDRLRKADLPTNGGGMATGSQGGSATPSNQSAADRLAARLKEKGLTN
jgi:DNA repair exonuclease SbcCD ATPase subunit